MVKYSFLWFGSGDIVAYFYGFCTSAEAIELGSPYWILRPFSYHIPEAVTTVFKCS